MKIIFDTAPLITCCKFEVERKPIIDHLIAAGCQVLIPSHVQHEVAAGQSRYADARVAEVRIKADKINVHEVVIPQDNVLNLYGLGSANRPLSL